MKFYLIGAALCCLVTGIYYTLKSQEKPHAYPNTKHDYLRVTNGFLSQVSRLWTLGELEGKYKKNKLNCPQYIEFNPLVAKRYLECNPRYIECLFSQSSLKNKDFSFSLKKVISYRPTRMEFILGNSKVKFSKSIFLNFKNSCHESALPKNEYTLESLGGQTWSSVNREIYVDKFLVSQNEVNFWRGDYSNTPSEWGVPALGLSVGEQRKFCISRGKRLMTAQIFEAASRLSPSSKLSIYPWTHYSANSKQGLLKAKIDKSLCSRAFLKECAQDYKWRSFQGDSVSWIGMHDVFGGPSERFSNSFEPSLNLKKADETVSFKSEELAKIGFKKQGKIPNSGIAFRCYREVEL